MKKYFVVFSAIDTSKILNPMNMLMGKKLELKSEEHSAIIELAEDEVNMSVVFSKCKAVLAENIAAAKEEINRATDETFNDLSKEDREELKGLKDILKEALGSNDPDAKKVMAIKILQPL